MEAWVIKRDDGVYYNHNYENFVKALFLATAYSKHIDAKRMIKYCQLENCKPVKVRIEEVENEKICN